VEKGILFLADIDEGSLQAGLQVLNAPFKDGPHFAGFTGAFDFELFEYAVLK